MMKIAKIAMIIAVVGLIANCGQIPLSCDANGENCYLDESYSINTTQDNIGEQNLDLQDDNLVVNPASNDPVDNKYESDTEDANHTIDAGAIYKTTIKYVPVSRDADDGIDYGETGGNS